MSTGDFQRLAGVVLSLVAGTCSVIADTTNAAPVVRDHFVYADGPKEIHVDLFRPAASGNYPSALVLHGAGGMWFDGPEMHRIAQQLAENGICGYVVHYFDGSGVAFTSSTDVLRSHFNDWLGVIDRAVTMVRQREASSGAQRPPIALYGYSMGAFLGLAAASDRDVAAVVEQAGGIWQNRTLLVGRLPPVLIIHGRRDRRVPYEQYCVPLQQTLRAKGVPFETRIFDQGHGFDPRAEAQARSATVEFLRRHLEAPITATFVRKPGQSGSDGTIQ